MALEQALVKQNELFNDLVKTNDDFHYSISRYYFGSSQLNKFHTHEFNEVDLTNIRFNACVINAKKLLSIVSDMYINNLANNGLINPSFTINSHK